MDDPSNQISIRIHYVCGYAQKRSNAHHIKPFTIYVDKTEDGKGSDKSMKVAKLSTT